MLFSQKSGSDAGIVFFARHDRLALEMTASFGQDLVFEMEASDAGADVLANRSVHHHGTAIARIHVGDDGRAMRLQVADHLGVRTHIVQSRQAQVGHSKPRC